MELLRDAHGVFTGPLNGARVLYLPAQTPFGNLQLKQARVLMRLAHANRRIAEVHPAWRCLIEQHQAIREPSAANSA